MRRGEGGDEGVWVRRGKVKGDLETSKCNKLHILEYNYACYMNIQSAGDMRGKKPIESKVG